MINGLKTLLMYMVCLPVTVWVTTDILRHEEAY